MTAVGVRPRAEAVLDRKWPVSLAFAVAAALLWQAMGWAGRLPDYIVGPADIASGMGVLATSGELWEMLLPSLKRAYAGFIIGATLGVVAGLVTGVLKPAEELLELPLAFTYPLPKIALFPAFAVWLGFTDRTRIVVIALACFYPAYLNANSGTRAVDGALVDVARNAEASRLRTFAQVIVPAALPRIFTGLQICLAVSFILLFATEIIGFSDGVGSDILRSSRDAEFERMYCGIAALALVGLASNRLLLLVGRLATRGRITRGVVHD